MPMCPLTGLLHMVQYLRGNTWRNICLPPCPLVIVDSTAISQIFPISRAFLASSSLDPPPFRPPLFSSLRRFLTSAACIIHLYTSLYPLLHFPLLSAWFFPFPVPTAPITPTYARESPGIAKWERRRIKRRRNGA